MVARCAAPRIAEPVPAYNLSAFGNSASKAITNRDTIVGIKVAHYNGPDWTPVEHGVEDGTLAKIPVMVDFGTFRPERPFQDLVLSKLRPGHLYSLILRLRSAAR
jgi:predicted amidohydrolase